MERKNRHSIYDLEYHLVVVTRYRHPVISERLKPRLFEIAEKVVCKDFGCFITSIEAMPDHVHLLFEAPPHVQLSKVVNSFKTVTSRLLRKEFPHEVGKYYWKPYFWSMSYFIATVSERSRSAVKRYIESQ